MKINLIRAITAWDNFCNHHVDFISITYTYECILRLRYYYAMSDSLFLKILFSASQLKRKKSQTTRGLLIPPAAVS